MGWRPFWLALTIIALLTLALAACQEDGPQDSRPDCGEAYVIPIGSRLK